MGGSFLELFTQVHRNWNDDFESYSVKELVNSGLLNDFNVKDNILPLVLDSLYKINNSILEYPSNIYDLLESNSAELISSPSSIECLPIGWHQDYIPLKSETSIDYFYNSLNLISRSNT